VEPPVVPLPEPEPLPVLEPLPEFRFLRFWSSLLPLPEPEPLVLPLIEPDVPEVPEPVP
jgi:hypothetical protein